MPNDRSSVCHGRFFLVLPIIAVTSYAMVGDRERILASGATGYIEKPINPETFVAEIARHLLPNRSDKET